MGNLINSLICNNTSTDYVVYLSSYSSTKVFSQNTVVSNRAATGLFLNKGCCGAPNSIKNCNIYNTVDTFELYTEFGPTKTIKAENNWWGTNIESEIQGKIFDWFDDVAAAVVDYSPYLASKDTNAPISPPDSVIKIEGNGGVLLSWKANSESDLAGYKIYHGSPTGHSFSNSKDIGTETSFFLSGANILDTIAITAYDNQIDSIDDLFEGHESWYATFLPESLTTSISKEIIKKGQNSFFTISPNPFRGQAKIFIDIKTRSRVKGKVYDLAGRLLKTFSTEIFYPGRKSFAFNSKGLSSGLYLLQVQTDQIIQSKKIFVDR